MRYALSRYKSERRDLTYRIYLTDALQAMAEGKYLKTRFVDVIMPPESICQEDANDFALGVLSRAGIEVTTENESI